eukprot:520027-Karenia_brevis.AAC.1
MKGTWRDHDAMLWLAAFGEVSELERWVANPVEFIQNREKVVLGFSDQIPVWVKIGRNKQVYCSPELTARK